MSLFTSRLRKAEKLIAKGLFGQLFSSTIDTLFKQKTRVLKYKYLQKKYFAFIVDKLNDKLRNWGGKTTETPNIIWWLWLQGEDNAPDICKSCLRSLRRWHTDKKIITLDSNNLHEYITLPDYINEKHEKGIIDNTKYSNLVRLQLLIKYGGTWIDSTVFCTGRKFEYIMHLPLFMFSRDKTDRSSDTWITSNWFIVSAPHDPVLTLTRDLHFQYWKDYDYCMHYFIFHMFFKMSAEAYRDEWSRVPYISRNPPLKMQRSMYEDYTEEKMNHFMEISDFHKLTYKLNPEHMPSEKSIYHNVVHGE